MLRWLVALLAAALSVSAMAEDINLAAWGSGARLVVMPAEYNNAWSAQLLLDDNPATGWAPPEAAPGPFVAVVELAAPSSVTALVFYTANVDTEGSAAKAVTVDIADGQNGPWRPLLSVELADAKDGQRHPVNDARGRYVRLTVSSNHGHAQWTELMGLGVMGIFLQPPATPQATGAFATREYGMFRMKHDGATAEGCYEHDGGRIANAGFDGRVLRFVWTETNGTDKVDQQGAALMVFADDGSAFTGYWWDGEASGPPAGFWNGTREATSPGSCAHWSPGESSVASSLQDSGRVRLYGILFDVDSDRLRSDSDAALQALLQALVDNPSWRVSIEGHTDASGSSAHNHDLSQRRAAAVQAYLVKAGIADERLNAEGKGSTVPVADNATTAGRSQNRRVEVVRH